MSFSKNGTSLATILTELLSATRQQTSYLIVPTVGVFLDTNTSTTMGSDPVCLKKLTFIRNSDLLDRELVHVAQRIHCVADTCDVLKRAIHQSHLDVDVLDSVDRAFVDPEIRQDDLLT